MARYNLLIDFDSTISSVELLPEIFKVALAERDDAEEILREVTRLTNAGMNGDIPFSESLQKRIALLPLTKDVIKLMVDHISTFISPSFTDCIKDLNTHNLHIVSGAFANVIVPVLAPLGIYPYQVHANKFLFEGDSFIGLDMRSPLVNDQGKVEVVKRLNLTGTTIMIGDGITDYQVKEAGFARFFIAYKEHITRPNVVKVADYTATSFNEVCEILDSLPD